MSPLKNLVTEAYFDLMQKDVNEFAEFTEDLSSLRRSTSKATDNS